MREGVKYHKRPITDQLSSQAQSINRLALKAMSAEGNQYNIEKLRQLQQRAADIIQIINEGLENDRTPAKEA